MAPCWNIYAILVLTSYFHISQQASPQPPPFRMIPGTVVPYDFGCDTPFDAVDYTPCDGSYYFFIGKYLYNVGQNGSPVIGPRPIEDYFVGVVPPVIAAFSTGPLYCRMYIYDSGSPVNLRIYMFNRSSPFPRNVLHYGRLRNTFQDDAFDERMQAIQPIRAAFTSFTPAKVYFIGGVGVSRVISYSFDSYLSTFRYEGESGFLPWTGTLVTAASMFYNTTSGVFDYLVYRKTTVDRFNLYNLKTQSPNQRKQPNLSDCHAMVPKEMGGCCLLPSTTSSSTTTTTTTTTTSIRVPDAPGEPAVSSLSPKDALVERPPSPVSSLQPNDGYNVYIRLKGDLQWKKVNDKPVIAPFPPGAPTVSPVSPIDALVEWSPSPVSPSQPADGYNVYIRPKGDIQWIKVNDKPVPGPRQNISGLVPGKEYESQVAAVNRVGEGAPSPLSTPFKQPEEKTAPSSPQNLRLTMFWNGEIALAWNASDKDGGSPIIAYIVDFQVPNTTQFTNLTTTPLTRVGMSVQPDINYHFRVSARNAIGVSHPTEIYVYVPQAVFPPNSPAAPTVSPVSAKDALVEWTPLPPSVWQPADGYNVYIHETGTTQWTKFNDKPMPGPKETVNGLFGGKEYEARMTAVNKGGESPPGPASQPFRQPEEKTAPSPPRNLQILGATTEGVLLAWVRPEKDGGSPVTDYVIEARLPTDAKWISIGTTAQTQFNASGLLAGKCDLRVSARNIIGVSPPVAIEDVQIKQIIRAPVLPGTPALSPTSPKDALVEWPTNPVSPSQPVDGYNIYIRPKDDPQWTKVNDKPVPGPKQNISGLVPAKEYEVQVTAVNDAGESPPSSPSKPSRQPKEITVPSSPRNLQVVSSSTIGAVLAWISPEKDGNSPVIDYIVDVRLPNNTKWTALGSTLQTNFTTGALPVGESDFRVSARNAVGVSLPVEIDEVRVKQMIQAPVSPGIPAVTPVSPKDALVEWPPSSVSPSQPADGYIVYIRTKGDPQWTKVSDKPVPGPKQNISDLVPGKEYEVQVTAVNDAGESAPSSPSKPSRQPEEKTVPSAPRNLQVVGATTDGAVLAWISPEKDGGSPVMDYITDVRLPNDTKWTTFGSTPQTQFTTPSLPVGKCDFRVSARNAIGVSLPLELDDVRIKQMIRAPVSPGVPAISPVSPKDATVEWPPSPVSPSQPADGYNAYIRPKGDPQWTKVNDKPVPGPKQNISGLVPGKEYEVQVTAVNEAGEGQPSSPSKPSRQPEEKTVPSVPRNLQVVGATTDGAVLAWVSPEKDGGSPVLVYIVDVRLLNETRWTTVGTTPQTQYVTPALPVGKSDFRVSARNAVGVSPSVEIDDVRIKQMIRAPVSPGTPAVSPISPMDALVEWPPSPVSPSQPADGYNVYVRPKDDPQWTKVSDKPVPGPKQNISGLLPGKEYEVQVTAVNEAGESPPISPSKPFRQPEEKTIPSPPEDLQVVRALTDNVSLIWKASSNDGGTPVATYMVEIRPTNSTKWGLLGMTPEAAFNWSELPEGKYDFRVSARNNIGVSLPAEIYDVWVGSVAQGYGCAPPFIDAADWINIDNKYYYFVGPYVYTVGKYAMDFTARRPIGEYFTDLKLPVLAVFSTGSDNSYTYIVDSDPSNELKMYKFTALTPYPRKPFKRFGAINYFPGGFQYIGTPILSILADHTQKAIFIWSGAGSSQVVARYSYDMGPDGPVFHPLGAFSMSRYDPFKLPITAATMYLTKSNLTEMYIYRQSKINQLKISGYFNDHENWNLASSPLDLCECSSSIPRELSGCCMFQTVNTRVCPATTTQSTITTSPSTALPTTTLLTTTTPTMPPTSTTSPTTAPTIATSPTTIPTTTETSTTSPTTTRTTTARPTTILSTASSPTAAPETTTSPTKTVVTTTSSTTTSGTTTLPSTTTATNTTSPTMAAATNISLTSIQSTTVTQPSTSLILKTTTSGRPVSVTALTSTSPTTSSSLTVASTPQVTGSPTTKLQPTRTTSAPSQNITIVPASTEPTTSARTTVATVVSPGFRATIHSTTSTHKTGRTHRKVTSNGTATTPTYAKYPLASNFDDWNVLDYPGQNFLMKVPRYYPRYYQRVYFPRYYVIPWYYRTPRYYARPRYVAYP